VRGTKRSPIDLATFSNLLALLSNLLALLSNLLALLSNLLALLSNLLALLGYQLLDHRQSFQHGRRGIAQVAERFQAMDRLGAAVET